MAPPLIVSDESELKAIHFQPRCRYFSYEILDASKGQGFDQDRHAAACGERY
ncbi:hypothetical protein [Sphingomonas sp. TDK1]|uniref:hypothetical protein n=1 Tax=Sphingomonas sp. TDK1 TaxID=453247 RepID=UPI0012ECD599|nr:hypothetical protein [Sphingomonas sp. TDK1]